MIIRQKKMILPQKEGELIDLFQSLKCRQKRKLAKLITMSYSFSQIAIFNIQM